MASLFMPEGKLTLRPQQEGSEDAPASRPSQVMRLNLSISTLDELLESLRNDKKARLRLGKHPALYYGSKSQSFHFSAQAHRSELYVSSPSTDKENMYFSGLLSHSLEVQKAKEATTATDEALATLRQSLSAFEKGKESRMTPVLTSIDQMRALKAGDNWTATGREAAGLVRKSTSKIDLEKERFFQNAASRSSPASPSILASRSPVPTSTVTPTSAPLPQNKDKIRLDALRVPLIHLLAIRPASVQTLAQQTRSSQEDCLTLLQKYGVENRRDRDKFDLKDKAYRELDVWKFPYPSQEERQEAIENAISAFDRMRISRQDKLWQMLLPKEERGKGKVLSRLNLSSGPIPKSVTPRINVQASQEPSKEGYGTGNESDAAMSGKRTPSASAKDDGKGKSGPQKQRSTDKLGPTKRASAKPRNTTLTGRVTKKTEKRAGKTSGKADSKFKSAEFVIDSDEDVEMVDVPETKPSTQEPTKDTEEPSTTKPDKPSPKSDPPARSSKQEEAPPKPPASKTVPSPSINARAGNSSSPQKPSPLGSSPPTNASDFEVAPRSSVTTQSPSSSSPPINQLPKSRSASGANGAGPTRNGASTNKIRPASQPLKRKAEADPAADSTSRERSGAVYGLGISHANGHSADPKRRRPSSSAGSSTGSASPSISHEILLQKLRDKSRLFKQYYAKYRALHEEMSNHPDPPRAQLEKLERQHARLEKMKQEIWDEDRRLRRG
ncbi:hypothetical protein VTO42DRAFT_2709 [Malbranchea cinnamomea]